MNIFVTSHMHKFCNSANKLYYASDFDYVYTRDRDIFLVTRDESGYVFLFTRRWANPK